MSDEDMHAELERLRRENEELKQRRKKEIRLAVSQKGAASLYGIRRFPITFYKEEWGIILGMSDEIEAFLAEHDAELSTKK